MTQGDRSLWGIHVTDSDGDSLYLKKNYIAIGWPEAGDLKKVVLTATHLRQERQKFIDNRGADGS